MEKNRTAETPIVIAITVPTFIEHRPKDEQTNQGKKGNYRRKAGCHKRTYRTQGNDEKERT